MERSEARNLCSAVESALRKLPELRDVAVRLNAGEAVVTAYVIPQPVTQNADFAHTAKWKKLSEFSYSHLKDAPVTDAAGDFNLAGWKSSYTDQPVPPAEMAEWVDETVSRILRLQPQRVLEIGCGTGLLLFRIAPSCQQYWATDISESVTQYVQRHVQANANLRNADVKVWRAEATDIADVPAGQFDLVVLNSVIQYFPGTAYLTQVIELAARALRPGGVIFVGDVRNFDSLDAFHLAVLLHNAKDSDTIGKLRADLLRRMESEPELAVSPAFFATLPAFVATAEPRRGRFHNEMTQFRYNAILWLDRNTAPPGSIEFQDWSAAAWTIDKLRQTLTVEQPAILAFTNVPDARTVDAARTLAAFRSAEDRTAVADFRRSLTPTPNAIDPQNLWQLEEEFPYSVQLGIGSDGMLNLLFDFPGDVMLPIPAVQGGLANDPGKDRRNQALVAQLTRALKAELSPSDSAHLAAVRIVVVDSLAGV